jgi:hypothetical protein
MRIRLLERLFWLSQATRRPLAAAVAVALASGGVGLTEAAFAQETAAPASPAAKPGGQSGQLRMGTGPAVREEADDVDEVDEGKLRVTGGSSDDADDNDPNGDGNGTLPVDRPDVYTIQPGDTLWDVSSRQLGNPWYWPKLWSMNPEIENPHLIYPGDQVRFYYSAQSLPQGFETPDEVLATGEKQMEIAGVSAGTIDGPTLVYQSPDGEPLVRVGGGTGIGAAFQVRPKLARRDKFISSAELDEAGTIEFAHEENNLLSLFDKVYVKFKTNDSVRIGDRMLITDTPKQLKHPKTGDKLGYEVRYTGELEIVKVYPKYATGVIYKLYDPVMRGNKVLPARDILGNVSPQPNKVSLNGLIVHGGLYDNAQLFGEFMLVFVDKGRADGVQTGNSFYVTERNDLSEGIGGAKDGDVKDDLPKERVGELLVIEARDNVSTCLVLRSERDLRVGDEIEMIVQN